MGTRARINVIEDGRILVSIYRQYDGYEEGLGKELASFTAGLTLVNGMGQDRKTIANGMGCYAALLIAHLKKEAGNVYIRDTSKESHGEEYIYNVSNKGGSFWIRVLGGSMTAFGLPGDEESAMGILYDGLVSKYLFARPIETEDSKAALTAVAAHYATTEEDVLNAIDEAADKVIRRKAIRPNQFMKTPSRRPRKAKLVN